MRSPKTLKPGATIGMVGGGQLGRMFAMAAIRMGFKVVVFCGHVEEPAAEIATRTVTGTLTDRETVLDFARQCDVITLEFENIPAETIRWCEEFAATYPSHHVLATAQDRIAEKSSFRDAGLAVTPFAPVGNAGDVERFAQDHGWPVIVKTARSGYDGKGQFRAEDRIQSDQIPWDVASSWIAEKRINFEKEASVVVARSCHGETRCFPPFENDHQDHILDVSFCPSTLSDQQMELAESIAIGAAEAIGLVGLLCVELFVVDESTLLINEVAPRPHNSGHLTIEACFTSQFEQHVRAVCGLPLGSTKLRVGGAAMANLLGDLWSEAGEPPPWEDMLACDHTNLHLYGKKHAMPGRKMGHVTATAEDARKAVARVTTARGALR
ncbi:MAG: 5-(carboxyamino)imidazole ribonucleotide synthase [Planctomycetota bacterium]